MTDDLREKVVLITGCSSGFGLITAVEMARSGFRVFASMRNLSKRGNLDAAAKEASVTLDIIELDVSKQNSIDAAVAEVERRAGPIDILVNNAGTGILGFAEDTHADDLQNIMDIVFFGSVNMTKAVIPKMRERRRGHIINISSILGVMGLMGYSAYCASKFAVEGYMEVLRYEGLLDGYCVSNIEPGFFKTSLFTNSTQALNPESPHYQIAQHIIDYDKNEVNKGQDPLKVAQLVIKIAKNPKPRFRYPIGKEKSYLLLKFLPESISETVLMKVMRKLFNIGT